MFYAAKHGDISKLETLLDTNPTDINFENPNYVCIIKQVKRNHQKVKPILTYHAGNRGRGAAEKIYVLCFVLSEN